MDLNIAEGEGAAGGRQDAYADLAELSDFVSGLNYCDLTEAVREKAKLCILDTVGCVIAGSRTDVAAKIRGASVFDAKGRSQILGCPDRINPIAAAFVNSTTAHVLELDDGHRPSDNHLGCVVVPAAIAVAQECRASGRALIEAVVAGYEVMGRIGHAVCLPRMETPFHGTSATGGFGSATAASRLLGLTDNEFLSSLRIAGTGASGFRESFTSGGDCKPIQVGRSSEIGVRSALMAAAGLDGPRGVLGGPWGFFTAMTPTPRPSLLTLDLGRRFAVTDSSFKLHSACGILFTAVDAALALRAEHSFDASEISEIKVALPGWVRADPVFTKRDPITASEARFSIPFVVAAALVEGEVTPRQISREGLDNGSIRALSSRIEICRDEEVESVFEATKDDDFFFYPSSVEIFARGSSFKQFESSPRGYDLRRGLSESDVVSKFHAMTRNAIASDRAAQVVDRVMRLETLEELYL